MTLLDDRAEARFLRDLLAAMVDRDASDLHLVSGYHPVYRIHGELEPAGDEPLSPEQTAAMVEWVLPDSLRERFEATHDCDFSATIEQDGKPLRFRVNAFAHQSGYCADIPVNQSRNACCPMLSWCARYTGNAGYGVMQLFNKIGNAGKSVNC